MKKDSKTKYKMTKAFNIFLYCIPLLLLIYAFTIWYFYSDGKVYVNRYIQEKVLKVEPELETITYTSSAYRIGFSYPKGWTVKEGTEGIFLSNENGNRYVKIYYPYTYLGIEEYAVQKLKDYRDEINSYDAVLSLEPVNIWYRILSYEYSIHTPYDFPDYTSYLIRSDYNIVDIKTTNGEIEKDVVISLRFLDNEENIELNNAKDFDISTFSNIKLKDYSNLTAHINLDPSWPLHVSYCKPNTFNYCLTILNKENLGDHGDRNFLENFEKTRDDILNSKLFVGAPEIFQFGEYDGQVLITEITDLQIPNTEAYIGTAGFNVPNGLSEPDPEGEYVYLEIYAVSGNHLLQLNHNGHTGELFNVSDEDHKSCIRSVPDYRSDDLMEIYDQECLIKLLNTPKYKQEIRNRFEELIKVFELE